MLKSFKDLLSSRCSGTTGAWRFCTGRSQVVLSEVTSVLKNFVGCFTEAAKIGVLLYSLQQLKLNIYHFS